MKKLVVLPLLVLVLFSCDKEKLSAEAELTFKELSEPQKWELVKMSGQIADSETTGKAMPWQEYYTFNPDGSFTKVRAVEGSLISATGTYKYHITHSEKYIELIYPAYNDLIGSCTSAELKETLIVNENGLQSNWWACDGPGLWYKLAD
ncbi:hypothetical protein [Pontibacter oryzae]|uniref:Lipocalin-like domain-containing protein n=1 Tax=Pontibacter oryzae TaxID=2304593 RepID=A0A399S5I0_9BACT|nr:hypothetical protein [Pontibacter oryzae]RIJ36825.1 hypothetical protein D1627_13410 [Pontibacter oryzae]